MSAREGGVVPDRLEERFFARLFPHPVAEVLVLGGAAEELERLLTAPALRGDAGAAEEHRHVLPVGCDAFLNDALELVDVPELSSSRCAAAVLPGRYAVRLAYRRADREDRGARFFGVRLADLVRNNKDARSRRRVDGLVVHSEGCAAADDDVQLLVDARSSARTLAMRRDDQLAAIGPVGADAEGLYSEFGSEREPGCRIRVSRSHVIEVQDLHGG